MITFLWKALSYTFAALLAAGTAILLIALLPIAIVANLITGISLSEMFDDDVKEMFNLVVEQVKELFKFIKES